MKLNYFFYRFSDLNVWITTWVITKHSSPWLSYVLCSYISPSLLAVWRNIWGNTSVSIHTPCCWTFEKQDVTKMWQASALWEHLMNFSRHFFVFNLSYDGALVNVLHIHANNSVKHWSGEDERVTQSKWLEGQIAEPDGNLLLMCPHSAVREC